MRREERSCRTHFKLWAIVAVAAILASMALAGDSGATPAGNQEGTWSGAGGAVLPFHDLEEVEDFLRHGRIVERHDIGIGVTQPERLTLEWHGVRADAVFRCYERTWGRAKLRDGSIYFNFTDSFRFEPAAYELARLLGMDVVPPAVQRRIGAQVGTLQMWVYDARMENERVREGIAPPDDLRWRRQTQQMILFDQLIGNVDRNGGNVLIDPGWKMWLIDHTRAFYGAAPFDRLERVIWVERDVWQRLQRLDRESLRAALGEHLSNARIEDLLGRRDRIVAHIDELLAERGPEAVLYDAI